jgi:hypothetical protein
MLTLDYRGNLGAEQGVASPSCRAIPAEIPEYNPTNPSLLKMVPAQ